jgi:hypothetical protein
MSTPPLRSSVSVLLRDERAHFVTGPCSSSNASTAANAASRDCHASASSVPTRYGFSAGREPGSNVALPGGRFLRGDCRRGLLKALARGSFGT